MSDVVTPQDSGEQFIAAIRTEVSAWPGVTDGDHRDGGREFHLGTAELGHIHRSGLVDVEFPRSLRDAVVEDGIAAPHSLAPHSGWTSFRLVESADVPLAVRLFRVSYLGRLFSRAHTHVGRSVLEELDLDSELASLPPSVAEELSSNLPEPTA
ncbi:luciferase family protein [Haloarchaeobius sp. TZWWS8]|uniref:luciferase domain-containing protein n=1 Tax=Haloarchaeobius sp. TZWWS8 TaxID=3446121 RepID=UPI003EBD2940